MSDIVKRLRALSEQWCSGWCRDVHLPILEAADTIERQRAVIEAAEEVAEWAMDSAVPGQFTPEPVTKLWNALRALDGGGDEG